MVTSIVPILGYSHSNFIVTMITFSNITGGGDNIFLFFLFCLLWYK